MSFTEMVHTGLITDQSDWFKAQVSGFLPGKVSTLGGCRIFWAFGPLYGVRPKELTYNTFARSSTYAAEICLGLRRRSGWGRDEPDGFLFEPKLPRAGNAPGGTVC